MAGARGRLGAESTALFAEYDGTLEFTPGGEEAIEKVIATGKI